MAKKKIEKPDVETVQKEIRKLALEIYQKRMADKTPGDNLADWLEAEKQVLKKHGF